MKQFLRLLLLLAPLAACAPVTLESGPSGPVGCAFARVGEASVTLQRNEPLVKVTVNDWDATMVLDTGAQNTLISENAARGMRLRRTGQGSVIHGIGGSQQGWVGVARELGFAGARLRDVPLRVANLQMVRPHGQSPDGMLGADVLNHFDLDLDLPNNRITLYKPRQCPEGGPNWGVPFVSVPIVANEQGRIVIETELDGVKLATVLDTGAETTTVSRVSAMRTGRGNAELDAGPRVSIMGATDRRITAHRHRFNTIRIGQLVARDPVLVVATLPPAARDAILGSDFLRARRVWISSHSGRVHISLPPQAVAAR